MAITRLTSDLIYGTCAVIAALLALRLYSLGIFPLYDTTEARYGEMARIMFETNNWITPQFDYGVPFWGKPPFQTWISALSFSGLGITELSARIPHFMCGLITSVLVFRFAKAYCNSGAALYALLVLTSSLGFIIAIGMVMTDSALLMAYTLAMVSFWRCYHSHDTLISGHLFFVALSLGMLIKGPVAVVLIVIALLTWSLWQHCFKSAIVSLPWLSGTCLFALLTLPWYVWAEIETPGFLEYFIVGEHIQRFLVSGWQGDLYGSAHVQPRGMIWLYWLVCASPWSFVVLSILFKRVKNRHVPPTPPPGHGLNYYLICWLVSPLLLFSLAGNILPIYVLPGFSALALLVAFNSQLTRKTLVLALSTLGLLVAVIMSLNLGLLTKKSEATLLKAHTDITINTPLYYWQKRPFSAQFYSKGQAQLLDDNKQLTALLSADDTFYLAIEHQEMAQLGIDVLSVCVIDKQSQERLLLKCH